MDFDVMHVAVTRYAPEDASTVEVTCYGFCAGHEPCTPHRMRRAWLDDEPFVELTCLACGFERFTNLETGEINIVNHD
jgi:hypothetical protein